MGQDSGKHREVLLEGEALFFLRQCRCAVSERNDPEALLVAGTRGGFHTAVGQEAGDGQCRNPA